MTETDPDQDFIRLLTAHQGPVLAYIRSLMPGFTGASDILQLTNITLWKKKDVFEPGTNFKAWALTIARFQAMTHSRVLRQRHWVTLDDDVAEMVAGDLEASVAAVREERRIEALRGCIDKLRDSDRELLMQRYWHKTRLQDFAVVSGRSLSGLKVQLHRLRAALKRCVTSKLEPVGAG